jgi:heme oxygenase
MPHGSWMCERLSAETKRHHADADSDFDVLFLQDTTTANYLVFLMRVYGFEVPLETALATTPNLELMLDLSERRKTQFLVEDVQALGLTARDLDQLPQCLAIPQFRGAAEALGWMYVVERATLAHAVIRRHLLTRLPREMATASQYLRSYEGVLGSRWRSFGVVLDDVARQPAIADRIVTAANEAFRAQRRWIQHEQAVVHAKAG